MKYNTIPMPDDKGYFGEYGGQIIPPDLITIMDEIKDAYLDISKTEAFQEELNDLYIHYVGRPSPIFFAKRLTEKMGGCKNLS